VSYWYEGKEYHTIKEILEFIPRECLVIHDDIVYNNITDDSCLCAVDAFATGKKVGIPVVQTAMWYHFGDRECAIAIKQEESEGELGWYRRE
jgi:hypothetical protein